MKKLNVKRITKKELAEKWDTCILPMQWPTTLYIRCNAKGEVNWEKAPVYFFNDLIKRGYYHIMN